MYINFKVDNYYSSQSTFIFIVSVYEMSHAIATNYFIIFLQTIDVTNFLLVFI